MIKYLKHEFKKVFLQWETWVVLAACCAIAMFANIEILNWFHAEYFELVEYRPYCSMLLLSSVGQLHLMFLGSLLASIPSACSYYRERHNHSDVILISKLGRNKYYISKIIVAAITGFTVAVLPLTIQYLFSIIAVPLDNTMPFLADGSAYRGTSDEIMMTTTVFPKLFMNYPNLTVFAHIGLFGLWVMGLTMLTYTVSLFFHKNLVITMSVSTVLGLIVMLVLQALKLSYLSIYKYLIPVPGVYNMNFSAFMLTFAVLILINIVLLAIKLVAKKDII